MGLFDKWFGRKPSPRPAQLSRNLDRDDDIDGDDVSHVDAGPIEGPPEFVRAVELQRTYWTHDAAEQKQLEARGVEQLSWSERLRLHHLLCLQRIDNSVDRATATEKVRTSAGRLLTLESPYRPRPALVWQGKSAQPGSEREPDFQGEFLNPSLTHLGCLEVYRVDDALQPTRLDFVSFDELSGVMFAPPSMLRAAKLFYDDGRGEMVLLPLLYGLTWFKGNKYDREGGMTRFLAHLDDELLGAIGAGGIGVGQQDLSVRGNDGGASLFGLGSVAEISFPLDMRDLRFDAKARARGIDPDQVRRQVPKE